MGLAHSWVAGVSLLLGFQVVAGCNSVLGIDQAQYDESLDATSAALTCDWPVRKPSTGCADFGDEGCSTLCPVNDCLEDQDCRRSLMFYRRCVGDGCVNDQNKCATCGDRSPLAAELFTCMNRQGCSIAAAASLCESYCACMGARCDQSVPGGSIEACRSICVQGDPNGGYFASPLPDWKMYCLWEHCEMTAAPNDGFHCPHANGTSNMDMCTEAPDSVEDTRVCPFGKGYGNAPCNTDADCCDECTAAKVCTDPK